MAERDSFHSARGQARSLSVASSQPDFAAERIWWSEAMTASIQKMMAEQTKQLQASFTEQAFLHVARESSEAASVDPLFSVIRAAVRAELGELAEDTRVREVVRSEVDAALEAWNGSLRRTVSKAGALAGGVSLEPKQEPAGPEEGPAGGALQPQLEAGRTRRVSQGSAVNEIAHKAKKQFTSYLDSVKSTTLNADNDSDENSDKGNRSYVSWWYKQWVWLLSVEEPVRHGSIARLINSNVFEIVVCTVIFLNCAFMVYAANEEMSNDGAKRPEMQVVEWAFQSFYTVELALKLVVYKQFFFWRQGWRLNTFDFVLVISGFVTLLGDDHFGTGGLRALRLLKFGKTIRAIKVMGKLEKLRCFLVCLHGSLSSFFWSLVMLTIVYILFSLFLMQIISSHIRDTGGDRADYAGLFDTVLESTLTLYMASTGGEDWSRAYQVIAQTGPMGISIYLIFIAFVQFALINIITGIFVESALATLSPDSEARAVEHARREKAHADELKSLCLQVDTDFSGKLTREQFEDGLRRRRIPRLLTLLQLQTHHVMQFFDTMSEVADDDGQVEIETFVHGCMQLKGPATNFDLQMFVAEFRAAYARQETALELQGQETAKALAELRELL